MSDISAIYLSLSNRTTADRTHQSLSPQHADGATMKERVFTRRENEQTEKWAAEAAHYDYAIAI